MADGCDYLTGQTLLLMELVIWSAGNFYQSLDKLTDEDWDDRNMIKSSNDADMTKRSV